ncbi:MAG: hypothetical protein H0U47_02720 [Nocardioidaceae bacterium]|nr:hypothetical protein [Nocardioidaceae bacterium]
MPGERKMYQLADERALEVRVHPLRLRLLDQWLAAEADWDRSWVEVAGCSDDLLRLTPSQAAAMAQEIWTVVQRYRDAGPDTDDATAERVVWLQQLVPVRRELPL